MQNRFTSKKGEIKFNVHPLFSYQQEKIIYSIGKGWILNPLRNAKKKVFGMIYFSLKKKIDIVNNGTRKGIITIKKMGGGLSGRWRSIQRSIITCNLRGTF